MSQTLFYQNNAVWLQRPVLCVTASYYSSNAGQMMCINPTCGTFQADVWIGGEDLYEGLKRETREEVQLEIDIQLPVDVHHFTRDDGQRITMLIFLCTPHTTQVRLSEEHTAFQWVPLTAASDQFPDWLQPVVERLRTVYTLVI